jgi:hypothetical protein
MDNAFVTQARADPDRVEVRNPQGRWLALVRRFRRGLSAAGGEIYCRSVEGSTNDNEGGQS